jgi:putative DNA primase/helicase
MKNSALSYAARGWRVIPLRPGTKLPCIDGWQFKASSDPAQIEEWWTQWPDANIGILAESVGVVIDLDQKHGDDAVGYWLNLLAENADIQTAVVETPTTGQHWYFTLPAGVEFGNPTGIVPGVDIRGKAGFVVAPPSVVDGKTYRWMNDIPPAEAPDWLLKWLLQHTASKSMAQPQTIPEGQRNTTLFKRACALRQLGYEEWEILKEIEKANQALVKPPLPRREVERLVKSAASYDRDFHLTDEGNAQRLVAFHGQDIRYIAAYKCWYVWNGQVWRKDVDGQVERYAKATVDLMFHRFIRLPASPTKDELVRHALRSESQNKLLGMVRLAQTEAEVALTAPADMDKDDFALAVENGVLDLRDGTLRPFDRADYITQQVPIAFDAEATCPRWEAFIQQATGEDTELAAYLQMVAGYALTGSTQEQCLFIIVGPGANGKSTFLTVLQKLVGPYGITMPGSTFMKGRERGIPNDLAAMKGKRLVLTSELEQGNSFSEVLLKNMTGQDRISCRHLYGEWFEYSPQFKVLIAANHLPDITGVEEAIWRRIRIVPFDVTVPPGERDPHLPEKLHAELPGILNWALKGCMAWQREGKLPIPSRVGEATRRYRTEVDKVEEFVQTCCHPLLNGKTPVAELYAHYQRHCEREGVRWLKKQDFTQSMVAKGYQKHRGTGGAIFLLGIGLLNK